MSVKIRRAGPGRFGTHPVHVSFSCGVNPLTANDTVTFRIPTPPGKFFFSKAAVQCDTPAADADGTCLLTVQKYDASADAEVALTDAYNIEGLTTLERNEISVGASVTDAQRLFDTGDTLDFKVVNNSAAINTQPTALSVTVELFQVN